MKLKQTVPQFSLEGTTGSRDLLTRSWPFYVSRDVERSNDDGPMRWMRYEERETIELHMLSGRCVASVAYPDPYLTAAERHRGSHRH
jgi:hypothetical protein